MNFQCVEEHLCLHHRHGQRLYLRNTANVFHNNIDDNPKRLCCMKTLIIYVNLCICSWYAEMEKNYFLTATSSLILWNIQLAPNPSIYLNAVFLRHILPSNKMTSVSLTLCIHRCQSHQFPYNTPDSKPSPWLSISSVIIMHALIAIHCSDLETMLVSCWHSLIHWSIQDSNRAMKWTQTDALMDTPLQNKKLRCSVKSLCVSLSRRMNISRSLNYSFWD